LLLGLAEQGDAMAILRELGLVDVTALVDVAYPVTRPPVAPDVLERRALGARVRPTPSPGPAPSGLWALHHRGPRRGRRCGRERALA
jgi:hypothetical protein